MPTAQDTYFANLTGADLAAELCRRVDRWQEHLIRSGVWALMLSSYQRYYGMGADGFSSHEVRRRGKRGELSAVGINHYRNLVTHYRTLAHNQRLALDPVAATGDWQAEKEVRDAKAILDWYAKRHLEKAIHRAVEYAATLGEGWVGQEWNAWLGEPVIPAEEGLEGEEGGDVRTGDLEGWAFLPQNVARDPDARGDLPWVITRRRVNRWDLVARFGGGQGGAELQREILATTAGRREREVSFEALGFQAQDAGRETDMVSLYTFWHRKTPACPEGRMAMFLDERVLLLSDALAYEEPPVRCVRPDEVMDSCVGYTPAFDLLAPQEVLNTTESIGVTNQRAFGVGIILAPKGSDVRADHITQGLSIVRYTPGQEPKLANFTGTPPEVFRNSERMVGHMETIIGVNPVVRGNPDANIKSGAFAALMDAKAVQFTGPFQLSITMLQEEVGTDIIRMFQDFATEAIRVEVTGEDGKLVEAREFRGEDIRRVRRVRVNVGNPLARTIAGRVQLADNLWRMSIEAQNPLPLGQYARVLETGRLEPLIEDASLQHSLIKDENEALTRADFLRDAEGGILTREDPETGQAEPVVDSRTLPIVMVTDDHRMHIRQHLSLLASTNARRNDTLRRAVMEHVRAHHDTWARATLTNPGMLELAEIPPMQSILAQAGAGMPPEGEAPSGGSAAQPQQQAMNDGDLPRMPQLPPGASQTTGINPAAPGPTGEA